MSRHTQDKNKKPSGIIYDVYPHVKLHGTKNDNINYLFIYFNNCDGPACSFD